MSDFHSSRIQVSVVGSGPDVILMPGMGSSPEIWRNTVAAVPGYRYHLVQVSGFAGSPLDGNSGSGPILDELAKELSRYIDETRLERPALIGHSMGGTVAMMVAARNPDAVSKLMVVDMLPHLGVLFAPPATPPAGIEQIASQVRNQILGRTEEARRTSTEAGIAAMVRDPAQRPRPTEHALASDAALTARVMYDLITIDNRSELARFTGPTRILYVAGPNIPLTGEQVDGLYQAQFQGLPQATLRRVPDSYHFIMLDQPGLFAEEVRRFLSGR